MRENTIPYCVCKCVFINLPQAVDNKSWVTRFYMLEPRILRWFIKFWKICGPHSQTIFPFKLFCTTMHTFTLNFSGRE